MALYQKEQSDFAGVNVTFWQAIKKRNTLRRGLKVSALVGTTLSLINQWEVILGQSDINVYKVVLTYIVPFCVSTYSTAASIIDHQRSKEVDTDHQISH